MVFRSLAAAALLLAALPSHADLLIDPARPAKPPVVVAKPLPGAIQIDGRPAFAGQVGVEADPAKRLPSMVSYAQVDRVIETGGPRPEGANALIKGWADTVPLDLALSQVVPSDWSVYAVGIDGGKTVSWSGGRPWPQVLGDLAYRGAFSANIQWDHRRVVIYQAGQPAPAEAALMSARVVRGQPVGAQVAAVEVAKPATPVAAAVCCKVPAVHSDTSLAVVSTPAPLLTPQPPVSSQKQWLIDPRLSLKQNVEAWARQAGWSAVVWEAADYEMVAPAVFTGDFASKDGPLAKLISAYSKSDQPLQVELSTQDRVVHVTNKNYQPAVVAPLVPSQVAPGSFK